KRMPEAQHHLPSRRPADEQRAGNDVRRGPSLACGYVVGVVEDGRGLDLPENHPGRPVRGARPTTVDVATRPTTVDTPASLTTLDTAADPVSLGLAGQRLPGEFDL